MLGTERIFHLSYTRRGVRLSPHKNVINLEKVIQASELSSNEVFHLEQDQDSIGMVVFTKEKKTYYLKIIFLAHYHLLRTHYVWVLFMAYIIFSLWYVVFRPRESVPQSSVSLSLFTDEKTKDQRCWCVLGHRARQWEIWDLKPGVSNSRTYSLHPTPSF